MNNIILEFNDGKQHKYEANIILNEDENDFYGIINISTMKFYEFLDIVEKSLNEYAKEFNAYAIIFAPDSDTPVFKVKGNEVFGFIYEDLTR